MSKLHHYLDSYAIVDFKKEYQRYLRLRNPSRYCPYSDIDGNDRFFYGDLVAFLNKTFKAEELKFEISSEISDKSDILGIKVQDKEGDIYLKSDQFGFSAPQNNKTFDRKKSYQYARYLSVELDDDSEAFVAECVYETRTIGGSFLWPGVKDKENGIWTQSIYNVFRGVGDYIEDRVDITLYEIKCFYEVYSTMKKKEEYKAFKKEYEKKYSKNILFNIKSGSFFTIEQQEKEHETMYRWLTIFESFEDYVEKLKFEPFVMKKEDGRYLILDMESETPSELGYAKIEKIREQKKEDKKQNEKNENQEMKRFPALCTLLNNVKKCTIKRSEAIEKLLNEG